MIKKILSVVVLVLFISVQLPYDSQCSTAKSTEMNLKNLPVLSKEVDEVPKDDINIYSMKCNELIVKQAELSDIKDKKEWFIAYKDLIEEYSEWCDSSETIYDCFTEDEICLMQRTIETECYGLEFDEKCNVASVILNRVYTGNGFGNNVHEVITKPNQFAYGRKTITDDTILALEYAFQIEDTTDGCIAFKKDGVANEDWYTWEYVFPDAAGHHFYKETK